MSRRKTPPAIRGWELPEWYDTTPVVRPQVVDPKPEIPKVKPHERVRLEPDWVEFDWWLIECRCGWYARRPSKSRAKREFHHHLDFSLKQWEAAGRPTRAQQAARHAA